MFDFNDSPAITDEYLEVAVYLAAEREEATAAWLAGLQEEEDHAEAVRRFEEASLFVEEADAQQDYRWACKGE